MSTNEHSKAMADEHVARHVAQIPPPCETLCRLKIPRPHHRRWAASWHPDQIANRLPIDFPDDRTMRISHETIYQPLYVHGRGVQHRCAAPGADGVPVHRAGAAQASRPDPPWSSGCGVNRSCRVANPVSSRLQMETFVQIGATIQENIVVVADRFA